MANLTCWNITQMPVDFVKLMENDLRKFDDSVVESQLMGSEVDKVIRDSNNVWIPTTNWISGWVWYYVQKMNRENFLYDIVDIDGGSIQYTQYSEGQFYNWHKDADIDCFYKPQLTPSSHASMTPDIVDIQGEYVRKLSFVVQLSDPEEYTGGELQFLDNNGKTFFAPKQLGTIVVFDSRTRHRVRKVRSGLRKSLVGWVVGPRWK